MEHYDPKNPDQHFFVTCAFGWVADANLDKALKKIRRAFPKSTATSLRVVVIHVPLPPTAHYEINFYSPQVSGITKIWEGNIP